MDYKILVPIDFTDITENALKYAFGAAKTVNTGITMLHIVNNEEEKIKAADGLDALIYKYEGQGISLKAMVIIGDIFSDIGATAEELDARVIIMGTHGMNGLQKLFGSNALKVITNSKIPFIITQDKIPVDNEINDIVVPIDLGTEDKQILISVIRSSHAFKAKVHLFVNKRQDEFHENAISRNLAFSRKYLRDHDVNFTVSHTNEMDNFDRELVRFSQNIGADLIAIINHNESGFSNLLGTNFDQGVITNDAKIPVLITNTVSNTLSGGEMFGIFA